MNKNHGVKGLGFVACKYCLLMKVNEGRGSTEQSGNRGKAVMAKSFCHRLPSKNTRTNCPSVLISTGVSVLSSSHRGETEQFPYCLHSLNIHPSCSKRKRKKVTERRKQASHFLWHLKLGGKAKINGYFQGH